ncbi:MULTISPECIES: GNAT family N-acetyltransferase [Aerococcus]|uniref:GNAT family N-acetyltransferase n=1 Tax=Aerococcus TaxID=1375 RepID=UPI0018A7CF03|nr:MULTISPECIES: GNAT family N-acetyltransferase [Aerococcus]MCY3031085.1 GNAT family N-acetyltransferase [Aerococcus sp. Group 1]MCY3054177.1 GNAT family N-acetyltransferase [Aerococcus sp. Group 1]MCY3055907.1 GNAT family N-acetyltransferase [Aerococcus sp. Group 1]MCY3061630.1 GNAT family N-acetyltransferase [Aerococcus sp. Group 1]
MEIRQLKISDTQASYQVIKVILEHLDEPLINEYGWETSGKIIAQAMKKPYYRYGYAHGYGVFEADQLVAVAYAYPGVLDPIIESPLETTMLEMGYSLDQIPRSYAETEALVDEFYLDSLATKQGEEGKGYARQLIAHLGQVGREKNYHKLSLNVDFHNQRALTLYQRLGFETISELIIGGHPHYHMIKAI